ncbi:hypothetical protein [Mycobacteroides abscessus]
MTREVNPHNPATPSPNSEEPGTREFKKVHDVLGATEFTELLERCHAAAKAAGRSFIYFEDAQFFGERSHAAYLQGLASSVQMDELAQRLNPDEFAPGLLEQMSRPARSHIRPGDLLNTGCTP